MCEICVLYIKKKKRNDSKINNNNIGNNFLTYVFLRITNAIHYRNSKMI